MRVKVRIVIMSQEIKRDFRHGQSSGWQLTYLHVVNMQVFGGEIHALVKWHMKMNYLIYYYPIDKAEFGICSS